MLFNRHSFAAALPVVLACLLLSSCASTAMQSPERAVAKAHAVPFEDRPRHYRRLLDSGVLSPSDYAQFMGAWNKANADIQKQMVAFYKTGIPQQIQQQQQQMEWERRQAQNQAIQNALGNMAQGFQRAAAVPVAPLYMQPTGGGIRRIDRPTQTIQGTITPAQFGSPAKFNGYIQ